MNELALFAGAGGGILGGHLLGWRTVAAVEIEDYPRRVLLQRQADGILPRFPVWDDVQTFDGKPWQEKVDVISGGFPCQDISCAGKGAGIDGAKSSMWGHMARIIGEVRPQLVFVENSPLLVGRGLSRVLGDLAEMGYDAKWGIVGAHHTGAPHKRDRIWVLGWDSDCFNEREIRRVCERAATDACRDHVEIPSSTGAGDHSGEARNEDGGTCREQLPTLRQGDGEDGSNRTLSTSEGEGEEMADASMRRRKKQRSKSGSKGDVSEQGSEMAYSDSQRGRSGETRSEDAEDARESPGSPRRLLWWSTESRLGRVVDGLADRLDESGADDDGNIPRVAIGIPQRVARLKAIGNGQVSVCAALAWTILTEGSDVE